MKLALFSVSLTLLLPAVLVGAAASVAAAPPGAADPLSPSPAPSGYPNRFPYGQCTWWAAHNHEVTWSGNAADWLRNAQAQGVATSAVPSVGAIAVFVPGGAYSPLGHVAIVTAVGAGSYTVSEMNAVGWGRVSTRTIAWPDPQVQGFIP